MSSYSPKMPSPTPELLAAIAVVEAAGLVVVPPTPTDAMEQAGFNAQEAYNADLRAIKARTGGVPSDNGPECGIWLAMVAAAPKVKPAT